LAWLCSCEKAVALLDETFRGGKVKRCVDGRSWPLGFRSRTLIVALAIRPDALDEENARPMSAFTMCSYLRDECGQAWGLPLVLMAAV
jgi:hypothetical protein